jgi:hypothetical protein
MGKDKRIELDSDLLEFIQLVKKQGRFSSEKESERYEELTDNLCERYDEEVDENFIETSLIEIHQKQMSKYHNSFAKGGMVDLFEDYEKLPKDARDIYEKYEAKIIEGDYNYKDSKNFLKEMELVGYTFDYGLDNEPYGLRPIGVSLNKLEGFEEFAKGGEVKVVTYGGKDFKYGDDFYKVKAKTNSEAIKKAKEMFVNDWFEGKEKGKKQVLEMKFKVEEYAKGGSIEIYTDKDEQTPIVFDSLIDARKFVDDNLTKYNYINIDRTVDKGFGRHDFHSVSIGKYDSISYIDELFRELKGLSSKGKYAKGGSLKKEYEVIVYWENEEEGTSGEKVYSDILAESEDLAENKARNKFSDSEEGFNGAEVTYTSINETGYYAKGGEVGCDLSINPKSKSVRTILFNSPYGRKKSFVKEITSDTIHFTDGTSIPNCMNSENYEIEEINGEQILFAKGGEVSDKYIIVDDNTNKIYFRGSDKELVELKLEELKEVYPNDKIIIQKMAKGGEVEEELKGEIIKETNSKVWTLQLYDDNGYHSSIYAPKKSDLTQYMREQGITKYAKGGEVEGKYVVTTYFGKANNHKFNNEDDAIEKYDSILEQVKVNIMEGKSNGVGDVVLQEDGEDMYYFDANEWQQEYEDGEYAKGGEVREKFEVELHWKGLSKGRTIGKYVITEKTLDELEEQWSHIISIDVLDNSDKKAISWFELKKELFEKGRDRGFFAKGGSIKSSGYFSGKLSFLNW